MMMSRRGIYLATASLVVVLALLVASMQLQRPATEVLSQPGAEADRSPVTSPVVERGASTVIPRAAPPPGENEVEAPPGLDTADPGIIIGREETGQPVARPGRLPVDGPVADQEVRLREALDSRGFKDQDLFVSLTFEKPIPALLFPEARLPGGSSGFEVVAVMDDGYTFRSIGATDIKAVVDSFQAFTSSSAEGLDRYAKQDFDRLSLVVAITYPLETYYSVEADILPVYGGTALVHPEPMTQSVVPTDLTDLDVDELVEWHE